MDARTERIALYVVVLVLAVAVGWLAFTVRSAEGPVGECVSCGEDLKPRFDALDTAIAGLGKAVAEAVDHGLAGFKQGVTDSVASRVAAFISAHDGKTTAALDGVEMAVAKAIESSLAGLEGRVADSVSNKLLAKGCQLAKNGDECVQVATPPCPTPETTDAGDCDDLPPLIDVESRFTFLYENARLNEHREVTKDSFGIKLAHRHVRRLDLLTSAFRPCHRADQPVKFRVTGYSSTAEFRSQPGGKPLPNSDALNLETANLRAQVVGDHLERQGFQVDTEQWPLGHDLERPYLDDVQPGMDQQALNRTVFIELESAGACDLSR